MLQQGTPEWLAWRRANIGASDSPIIMGASKWSTPYELWLYKTGQKEEKPMNRWMQRGKDLEDEARTLCEKELGVELFPQCVTSKLNPFMIASMDGLSLDGEIAVEIKCPGYTDHQCALHGEVPNNYMWQLQHQMYVCELGSIFYYSYDGNAGILLQVHRNNDMISSLLQQAIYFIDCVTSMIPPKLCDRDRIQVTDDSLGFLERELIACIEAKKEIELQESSIRERILSKVNMNIETDRLKITRYSMPGRIDYSKVPQLKDVDLEPYRGKSKECWKITVK